MPDTPQLRIEGDVERPLSLSVEDLAGFADADQVGDLSRLDPKRAGTAVTLAALVRAAGARPAAKYLTLHASRDDFHASIPLAAVLGQGLLVYAIDGGPLPQSKGGPFRFFIPDRAACHTHEIDECANVKFVDRLELSAEKGFDNRPHDDTEHEALHAAEAARKANET